MKRLILIRHAKSSSDDLSLRDWERPLSERGMKDAPRMGAALREHTALPDSLFCSSANRAHATARRIAKGLGLDDDVVVADDALYTFDERSLLAVIHAFPSVDACVAVVGHNPACHILCESLTGAPIEKFVTCGTAIIDFDIETWRKVGAGVGRLKEFLQPRHLT